VLHNHCVGTSHGTVEKLRAAYWHTILARAQITRLLPSYPVLGNNALRADLR
jgi:hypothetical protein